MSERQYPELPQPMYIGSITHPVWDEEQMKAYAATMADAEKQALQEQVALLQAACDSMTNALAGQRTRCGEFHA